MDDQPRLHVWTDRGKKWAACLVRDHGGLLTIGFELGQAPRLKIGQAVEWAKSDTPIPRRLGSVTSTYATSTLDHIVVSPSAPAAPPRPAPIVRSRTRPPRPSMQWPDSAS